MDQGDDRNLRFDLNPAGADRVDLDDGALWRRLEVGDDPDAREALIRMYLPYAISLARRFQAAKESSDDLVQVASLGLVKAVDRFDYTRGVPFQGFASPTILGELKRHFRDRVWTVRVPRGLHDGIAEVEQASADLRADLQRAPSVREIAERLSISETDVLEALEANRNRKAVSLDQPAAFEEGEGDLLVDRMGSLDEGLEGAAERIAVEGEIPNLGEREQLVLRLRFIEDMTQTQIAARVGCSQMQVSRILSRTLAELRERIGDQPTAGEGRSAGPSIRKTT